MKSSGLVRLGFVGFVLTPSMRASMGGMEAVAGRKLPAVADAVASGLLPAPAPARTWGSGRGEGCGFCEEHFGGGGQR